MLSATSFGWALQGNSEVDIMEAASPQIPVIAYRVAWPANEIVPASAARAWIDRTRNKWAYRCLPLLIANQAGWFILNAEPVEAVWHGGDSMQDLEVLFSGKYKSIAPHSHFGYGVLTWNFPWLFRTPPGYNLVARGPTNWPKDGISALDGIIETDWASASFSMNWKFTRPGVRVRFEAGEPLCMFYPQKRHELESVSPELRVIQSEPELKQKHAAWSKSREEFNQTMQALPQPKAQSEYWQKHYFLGKHVAGGSGSEHQTKLFIQPFVSHLPQDELPVTIAPDVSLPLVEMEQIGCEIPSVLHQIVPPSGSVSVERYRRTWTEQNPDWETRIWTLESGREFISNQHAWFLPLYDSYPQDRMRADVLRYFLLYTFGGVYADLDKECLQPFRTLLTGKRLVVGCEQDEHVRLQAAHKAGLSWLISNSVVCSVPGHAFWPEVFRNLVKYGYRRNPPEATGAILLTRAYESFADRGSIYLLDSAVLSPVTNIEAQASETRSSFVLPHPDAGCGFGELAIEPPASVTNADELDVNLVVRGRVLSKTILRLPVIGELTSDRTPESTPRVSCVMVARGNLALAMLSIRSFQHQTWPNREMLIVHSGMGTEFEKAIAQLCDPAIRYCRGSVDIALAEASGDWIALWAEDELSHPQRLELQFAAVETLSAQASFLQRRFVFDPADQSLSMSRSRVWEGTLFCRKDEMSAIPLVKQQRLALVDRALLYLEIRHSSKPVNPKWDEASVRYDPVATKQIRDALQVFYPLEDIGKNHIGGGAGGALPAAALRGSKGPAK